VARTAASIISGANQIAKTPAFTTQALDELNSLLLHIAQTVDFSAARGRWDFTFNSALTSQGSGNIITAGPNALPIDYLRVQTSGGTTGAQRSSKWYLNGVPYDMVEIDLSEWDDQVQQAGMQSYPYFWAKDLASYQPIIEITGNLSSSTQTVSSPAIIDTGTVLTSIIAGMSIAGGIGPLSVIPPGTTITAVNGSPVTSLTLSAAPTATLSGATLLIGNPGNGYPYPPPSGAFNAMIRYQRRMPRLTQTQVTAGAYPWFDDDMTLVEGLAGLMMRYSDDSRVAEFIGDGLGSQGGRFGKRMGQYIKTADDRGNRSATRGTRPPPLRGEFLDVGKHQEGRLVNCGAA
jgi:hypothetical protein